MLALTDQYCPVLDLVSWLRLRDPNILPTESFTGKANMMPKLKLLVNLTVDGVEFEHQQEKHLESLWELA